MELQNRISQEKNISQQLTIAERWDKASEIWHSVNEKQIIKNLIKTLKINDGSFVADVACGTGFHSFLLKELGFSVIASDVDDENLKILKRKQLINQLFFPVIKADWQEINKIYFSLFDGIFCLGSSITYFESWDENSTINIHNRINGLIDILYNFKSLLNRDGKLIIGYSKHYPTGQNKEIITFQDKIIDGINYEMKWELDFDWIRKRKKWTCEVKSGNNDYTFKLHSHLYSLEEFTDICKLVFSDIEVLDLDENYYDVFIICK